MAAGPGSLGSILDQSNHVRIVARGMSYTALMWPRMWPKGVNFAGLFRGSVSKKSRTSKSFTYTWPRTKYQTNLLKNKYHITIIPHHCGDCEMLHFLLDIGPNRNQTINEGLATSSHLYTIAIPFFIISFIGKKTHDSINFGVIDSHVAM